MLHNTRHRPLPRNQHPKITRLGKRRRVTLIAAFRCGIDGDPGVIICADSQESIGEYRVTVNKIKPRDCNNYDLVIGGAGNLGPLIDGLANTIERYIQAWDSTVTEERARNLIQHKIGRYTQGPIQNYPSDVDKVLDFIICLRNKATKAIYLWRTSGTVVEPIEYWDLIGWDDPLYKYEAERLYEKDHVTKLSAITLGLHLLAIGKATARNIDEPFQVIGISKEQVWIEPQGDVQSLTEKINRVNNTLSRLIISTPNLSVPMSEFEVALQNFESELKGLRQDVRRIVEVGLTGVTAHAQVGTLTPVITYPDKEQADQSEGTPDDG